MSGVSLVGESAAGGVITGPGAGAKLRVNGKPVSLIGDAVAGHGDPPHSSPRMVQASSKLRVGGKGVVLAGHAASCGHTANGNPKMTCSQ